MIRCVDATRVVDGIHVDQDTVACRFDTPRLGGTEAATLADYFGSDLFAIDANRVIGSVPHVIVSFVRCLDVTTNTTVVDQVYGRLQHRFEQFIWGHLSDAVSNTKDLLHLLGDFY